MKKSIITIVLITVSFIFSNCGDMNLSKSDGLIDESKPVTLSSDEMKSLNDTVCFKSCKTVILETTDASLLRNIDRICLDNNRLFVFDKTLNKIFIFDSEGKYRANINRLGQGPSEYQGVIDFCLDTSKKQILVLCHRPYKVMWFTYDGNFIKEKNTDQLYLQIAADSKYIYCTRSELNKTDLGNLEIDIFNHDLNIINDALFTRDNITNNLFNGGNQLTSTKQINYARRFDNVIYQIKNGVISKKYVVDFKKHTLPKDILNNNYSNSEFWKICNDKKYVFSIKEIIEGDNFMSFNTNIGMFILDKRTLSLKGYKSIFFSKLRMGNNSYFSVGNSDNKIACSIQPGLLSRMKLGSIKVNLTPQALELSKKVKDEGNPILLIYEFK